MIIQLTIEQIASIVRSTPEQNCFDWKSDFVKPDSDEKRGELIKDISAISNSPLQQQGYVFYGVNPHLPDPIVGISTHYDDAKLQQLVKNRIAPLPEFLYYEVSSQGKVVGVLHIEASKRRPHIITTDIGKVRAGQIVIRRGSSTDAISVGDLYEMFFNPQSEYLRNWIQKSGAQAAYMNAHTNLMRETRLAAEAAKRDLDDMMGIF